MKFKAHLAIVILMILGSAILANQVIQPFAIVNAKADVEQSKDDGPTGPKDKAFVLQANIAINSFSQVTLHQERYQIREIILDEVVDSEHVYHPRQITESDHFRTLFRQVISPNAP
jgi:hypothetical protein